MIRVFTYGSLKKGFHNHYKLGKDARFIKDDTVKGKMYSNYSYPLLFKGDDTIHGEIYDISEIAFLNIMSMELQSGYACEFTRTASGEYDVAIFYYAREDSGGYPERYIKSGIWDMPNA